MGVTGWICFFGRMDLASIGYPGEFWWDSIHSFRHMTLTLSGYFESKKEETVNGAETGAAG